MVNLRNIPLFAGVVGVDFSALSERAVTRTYPKNAVIVSEGDRSNSLYVILSGTVKIFLADAGGKELILDIKGEGDYFGEMVLDKGPRSASVMSVTPLQCAVISSEDFTDFLLKHPEVAFELIKNLIRLTRGMNANLHSLAMLDVYGRVARMLLDNAVEHDGKLVIPGKLTQKDMAARVGASREMVSRILHDLSSGGYISMVARRITINRALPARW